MGTSLLPVGLAARALRGATQGARPVAWLAGAQGLLAALGIGSIAMAQLPQPVLHGLHPAGGQPGTSRAVTVQGTDLDASTGLVFGDPRVTARPRPDQPNVFDVTLPPGLGQGFLDVRLVGRHGVSNPRVFVVESTASWVGEPTNATAASALPLAPGTAAWGRVPSGGALWYAVNARRGDRVLVRVLAPELDSRLAPMVSSHGPDGREWARVRRQGLLDFVAPADGPARVQVTDAQYRGGDDFFFRVEAVLGAHVEGVIPCVVTAGATNRVTVLGRRLPGGRPSGLRGADGVGLEQVDVDVVAPSMAGPHGPWPVDRLRRGASASWEPWMWSLATSNGPANPVPLALTTLPVVAQAVPASEAPSGTVPEVVVRPPADVGGWLGGSGTAVVWDARKGDAWWGESWVDRLGAVADVSAWVQREEVDSGGKRRWVDVAELAELDSNPASGELNVASRDAAGRFEAPQDGRYRVMLRDAFNVGPSSPRRPFRLSMRRTEPTLRAWAWAQPPPRANNDDRRAHVTTPTLRRGGTLPVRVAVSRLEGLEGPVEVTASGMPAGVEALPARIHASQSSGTVLLTAAPDAPAASFELRMVAVTMVGTRRMEHRVVPGGVQWAVADTGQDPVSSRIHQSMHVGVVPEDEPVVVSPGRPGVFEAKAGSKLSIPLSVLRRHEFPGAFNLKAAGHPALEKSKEVAVPEKATNLTAEVSLSEAALPEGDHVVWFQGQVAGKYRQQPEAVAAAEAAVKTAKAAQATATATDKPKADERLKAAEAAFKAAEERAKPRDVTLGVWSAPVRVRILPAK